MPSRQAQRLKILVAEDNALNQRVLVAVLTKAGHEVVAVGDGVAALTRLQHERFDLVLMDLQMPRMDGLTTTRRLRALESGQAHRTPVVALTADRSPDDEARCRDAGLDGCLGKPLDVTELQELLDGLEAAPEARSTPDERLEPAFDLTKLRSLIRDDLELARELAQLFLRDSATIWRELEQAVTEGELERAPSNAHALKSMLLNLCAQPSVRAVRKLESALAHGDAAEARDALNVARAELARLREALDRWEP